MVKFFKEFFRGLGLVLLVPIAISSLFSVFVSKQPLDALLNLFPGIFVHTNLSRFSSVLVVLTLAFLCMYFSKLLAKPRNGVGGIEIGKVAVLAPLFFVFLFFIFLLFVFNG